ncbi:hypothetical protein [Pontiella sulfatireligans]|uniref:Uncharacterized protein n=1 Tax=Pontiella sulfatireligans TaxID=2750658 RepID=A0A6C2UHU9_9BACT|nr:hypothetical protein [Pontiella sulfatireligans]VGO19708.1 hypothetical protein SCARR_01767 [Pontiella sulfatireligans]
MLAVFSGLGLFRNTVAAIAPAAKKLVERIPTVCAQAQIRKAAKKYLIVAGKLTPTVYTTVKNSGEMLSIRYLVDPRQRCGTEQKMWKDILDAFAKEPHIDLAYNNTRYYKGIENLKIERPNHE